MLLYFQVSHIILCAAFHTRLITQSCDHYEVFHKIEHKILIYDQQIEWTAPQSDGRGIEKQKMTRT